jgi:hypothetical protein
MGNNVSYTFEDKANTHDATMPLLESMYAEFKEFSKKNPDAVISKNKIRIVNRLLERIRKVLIDEESIEFLDLLDEDEVPQSGDVTLILSQYVAAMQGFKSKYYGYRSGEVKLPY